MSQDAPASQRSAPGRSAGELETAWLDAINSRTAQAVPVAERLLQAAVDGDDPRTAARAEHVLAMAYLNDGQWRAAEPYISGLFEHLGRSPDSALSTHGWVFRASCLAEQRQADAALEALAHAELCAEEAAEPSDLLAIALSDLAMCLGELAIYEQAERILAKAADVAAAAGAPPTLHMYRRGRNLATWAMRLEHLGRREHAAERFREAEVALQVAREAEPDPRFSLESWVMTSIGTMCQARAALLLGERWRPPASAAPSARWMVQSSHGYEDAQWRVHAAASVALLNDDPRLVLTLLDGLHEEDYGMLGPRLADRWHLYSLAHEQLGDYAAALQAHRKLHQWYDEDAYRSRRERGEAARARVVARLGG